MTDRSIALAALDKADGAERAAYLDEACGADAALRQRVEELLEATRVGRQLRWGHWPVLLVPPPTTPAPLPPAPRSTSPPAARLAKDPARGSARTSCSSRSAKAAWASSSWPSRSSRSAARSRSRSSSRAWTPRQVIARFEAERQALALMDHPNIARVLDAGTTDTGRPYFVMELVNGVPITEYCDRQPPDAPRAAGAVRAGLPGDPARPPEGDHPPRHQAVERAGDARTTASRCPR